MKELQNIYDLNEQNKLFNNLIKSTKNLIKIVEEENNLLESGNGEVNGSLLKRKITAYEAFNRDSYSLADYRSNFGLVKTHVANSAEQLIIKLKGLNQRNEILLKINIEISENIIKAYKEAKHRYKVGKLAYDHEGNVVGLTTALANRTNDTLNNKV